jgi:hypothetical protein
MLNIQDRIIDTSNYKKNILKDPNIIKCRDKSETIEHITGAGDALTHGDYTHCHLQIANIIHQELGTKCVNNVS